MPRFPTKRTLPSDDLIAFLDEEEDDYYQDEFYERSRHLRQDIRRLGYYRQYIDDLGLTKKQAELASSFKMPATKRKSSSTTANSSKKYKTSKSKYGGGTKKGADKYGSKGIDWATVEKLADRAAKKEINKNIETQYSQMMVTMTHHPDKTATQGFDLGGLNFNQEQKIFRPDQAMIFNLCYLSQPGSSLMPGFRVGQRINAKYFKITVSGNLPQVSADCTYHMRIVRRKSDRPGQASYGQPSLVPIANLELFKNNTDGPLATQSSYGEFGSAINPFPFFASSMRANSEAWTFVQKAHVSKYVKAGAIDTDASDQKYVASFCETLYFPMEEEWEFVTRNGSDIKGGNYFLLVWREGGPDFVQYSAAPAITNALGKVQLKVACELAFKDG